MPESVSSKPPAPRYRFRRRVRLVLMLVLFVVAAGLLFPIISEPRIDVSTSVEFGNPSSVAFQISNESFIPVTDVEYSCEVSHLMLANGTVVNDASVVIRGIIRRIQGRRAMIEHCRTGYIIADPVRTVEYQLTLSYRTYPWPHPRTTSYRITARVDAKGQVTGWTLN